MLQDAEQLSPDPGLRRVSRRELWICASVWSLTLGGVVFGMAIRRHHTGALTVGAVLFAAGALALRHALGLPRPPARPEAPPAA